MSQNVTKLHLKPLKLAGPKVCEVQSCGGRHYAKGVCKKHYAQVLRHGRLTPEKERGAVRTCKADGCARTDTIKWYCRKHARQLRVHGRLTPEREHAMGHQGCRVARCTGPHRAKGLCASHYNQKRWANLKAAKAAKAAAPKRSRKAS